MCIFVNDKADADADVLKALAGAGVRLIALRCTGFNNVDLKAAAQFGIKVVRVVSYSPSTARFIVPTVGPGTRTLLSTDLWALICTGRRLPL